MEPLARMSCATIRDLLYLGIRGDSKTTWTAFLASYHWHEKTFGAPFTIETATLRVAPLIMGRLIRRDSIRHSGPLLTLRRFDELEEARLTHGYRCFSPRVRWGYHRTMARIQGLTPTRYCYQLVMMACVMRGHQLLEHYEQPRASGKMGAAYPRRISRGKNYRESNMGKAKQLERREAAEWIDNDLVTATECLSMGIFPTRNTEIATDFTPRRRPFSGKRP